MNYLISQIFVIMSYLSLGSTYFFKNRKLILIFSLIAVICNGFGFFFLSAWSGLAMSVFALLRNVVFLIQNKYKKSDRINLVDWLILTTFIAISVILAVLTFDGFGSMLSVVATLVFTISVWQKNVTVYKILGICSSAIWIAYGVYIMSLFNIILESVLLVIEVVGLIKEHREKFNNKNLQEI